VLLMADWRARHPRWAHCLVTGGASLAGHDRQLVGHDWARARGLPFAPTVAANDPQAREQCAAWIDELGCALIAKPRAGNGSRGVRLLLGPSALAATLGDVDLVIQPYLSDAGPYRALQQQSAVGLPLFWTPTLTQYVAQTVIGPEGAVLGRFDMEAEMVAGRCERARPFDDPQLRDIGDRCVEPGRRGLARPRQRATGAPPEAGVSGDRVLCARRRRDDAAPDSRVRRDGADAGGLDGQDFRATAGVARLVGGPAGHA
jgi:hypothetical protein